ncbi:MAG: hypothetical protein GHCLOJNM_03103 [bacterium]|nr:hypothetical protein [bacterium]
MLCKPPAPTPKADTYKVASHLHQILEFPDPIPEAVIRRAAEDPEFLHELIARRKSPEDLWDLFASASELPPTDISEGKRHGPLRLAARFLVSILKWAASGFRSVDPAQRRRRLDACARCPHQVNAPAGPLGRAVRRLTHDERICDLCGCSIACKVRLGSERCPDPHPFEEGLSRWGEPLV